MEIIVAARQNNRIEEDQVTIRPSPLAFLIFSLIWGVLCLPGIDAIRLGQWQGLLFIVIGGVITVGTISRYRISWNTEEIIYRGLLTTQCVRLSEIGKFDIHGPMLEKRFGPTLGLRIFSVKSDEPVMIVNIKPFARRDIKQLKLMLEKIVNRKT